MASEPFERMDEMEDIGLGKIIEGEQQRDAIHVAIAPVVAADQLDPGQHIGIDSEGLGSLHANKIGIVDPFLKDGVFPGQRFWLFLYPNTVTGMRHHWVHPAFTAQESVVIPADKAASEAWLRNFISKADCPDYHTVLAAAINGTDAWDDDYMHFSGVDAHGEIPAEFWRHVEVVTGQKISLRPKFFSCGR